MINSLSRYLTRNFLNVIILLFTFSVGVTMVIMHPYQNIYFNYLVGINAGRAKFKFEMDYWGMANREALEKLYFRTDDRIIKVYSPNPNCSLSAGILPKNMRSRFQFTSHDKANYFIADYRWARHEFNELKRIDSVKVDGAVISATYRLNVEKSKIIHLIAENNKYVIAAEKSNFMVSATGTNPSLSGTFTLIDLDSNKYAIQASNDLFLCAELQNMNELTASRESPREWETFRLYELENRSIALMAANGKYLRLEESSMMIKADADSIGPKSIFKMQLGCFGCDLFSKGYIYSE